MSDNAAAVLILLIMASPFLLFGIAAIVSEWRKR